MGRTVSGDMGAFADPPGLAPRRPDPSPSPEAHSVGREWGSVRERTERRVVRKGLCWAFSGLKNLNNPSSQGCV